MTLVALLLSYQAQVSKHHYSLSDAKECQIAVAITRVGGQQDAIKIINKVNIDWSEEVYAVVDEAVCRNNARKTK